MAADAADDFKLSRFVEAQASIYEAVKRELASGDKQSHWMWFVFPQLRGLGRSPTADFYAISGREEGLAYLHHPVLGQRLLECTQLVLAVKGRTAEQIFHCPDVLKFHSSMTLFDALSGGQEFSNALVKYFAGKRDERTVELLGMAA